jgi:Calcineurin-like phosphoesterase
MLDHSRSHAAGRLRRMTVGGHSSKALDSSQEHTSDGKFRVHLSPFLPFQYNRFVPTFVIGDVHGCLEALTALLQREGLINQNLEWAAQDSRLWFLGDYTDRGSDGIGVIELIMRLQNQAAAVGGFVGALLGNHDVLLLQAWHFPSYEVPSFRRQGVKQTFFGMWLKNGGQMRDFERLTEVHANWLSQRPALAVEQTNLLMHADSEFYLEYGQTIRSVNARIRFILESRLIGAWDALEERFATRRAFVDTVPDVPRVFANRFDATRIIHGHTPITSLTQTPPTEVTQALEYADGTCVNVDHCLYRGGQGFVYQL